MNAGRAGRHVALDYLNQHVKKAEYDELTCRSRSDRCTRFTRCSSSTTTRGPTFAACRHDAIVTGRLWYVGSGAALVLALLGTLYGYLKLDLRTGGAHKGQLATGRHAGGLDRDGRGPAGPLGRAVLMAVC